MSGGRLSLQLEKGKLADLDAYKKVNSVAELDVASS